MFFALSWLFILLVFLPSLAIISEPKNIVLSLISFFGLLVMRLSVIFYPSASKELLSCSLNCFLVALISRLVLSMNNSLRKYLFQPHRLDCPCVVCSTEAFLLRFNGSTRKSGARLIFGLGFMHLKDCRPAGRPYLENGRWWVVKAKCVCHLSRRPPDYWTVVRQEKAPPFVPIGIFELE